MRRSFITGLILLLPVAVTILITIFVINFFTAPFVGIVQEIFKHYGILENGFLFLSSDQVQRMISQLIILLLLFFFTVFIGILTRWVFVHYFIRFGDYIFHHIPIINSIYKTTQDVIKTVFTTEAKSFKQVVLVPFPNANTRSIGLLTCENMLSPEDQKQPLAAVFIPTTPNPTSGFLMLFKQEDITYLDMKVDEAFKYVISCGVIQPSFAKKSNSSSLKKDEER